MLSKVLKGHRGKNTLKSQKTKEDSEELWWDAIREQLQEACGATCDEAGALHVAHTLYIHVPSHSYNLLIFAYNCLKYSYWIHTTQCPHPIWLKLQMQCCVQMTHFLQVWGWFPEDCTVWRSHYRMDFQKARVLQTDKGIVSRWHIPMGISCHIENYYRVGDGGRDWLIKVSFPKHSPVIRFQLL